jgi:hypothetical protein
VMAGVTVIVVVEADERVVAPAPAAPAIPATGARRPHHRPRRWR